jgi:dTDP-4-dehydrorhamnose 3,5-epimerase
MRNAMSFEARSSQIEGLVLIEHEPFVDERGSFERWWCKPSFAELRLDTHFTQMSLSRNTRKGTLRGMHVAIGAGAETKLIRCMKGAIFDVIADVRPGSPTFGRWQAFTLRADTPLALHVAPGLAHGFLTLEDESEVLYMIDTPYVPSAARTISYRDPDLAITWPSDIAVVSDRDAAAAGLTAYYQEVVRLSP